jgi:hypothetical protein
MAPELSQARGHVLPCSRRANGEAQVKSINYLIMASPPARVSGSFGRSTRQIFPAFEAKKGFVNHRGPNVAGTGRKRAA